MKFRYKKISLARIAVSGVLIVAAFVILTYDMHKIPTSFQQDQIAAARLMHRCIDSLSVLSFDKNSRENDPNQTNLIGAEYSEITTTLGDLIAKRTSTNPDFAALLVKWFHEINLKPGDVAAVGCSGSFPALILATICASEVMRLKPVIIASLGSSSFGANRPDFTYLDMEAYLYNKNVIQTKTQFVSLGGGGDISKGLSAEGRALLKQAVQPNQREFIQIDDLEKNIATRIAIYFKERNPKVFVNIGGAQINVGDYEHLQKVEPGLNIRNPKTTKQPDSVMEYFGNQGVPIIHLLGIKQIAHENWIQIDPVPLPEPGDSGVYFTKKIKKLNLVIASILVAICSAILLIKSKNGRSEN